MFCTLSTITMDMLVIIEIYWSWWLKLEGVL